MNDKMIFTLNFKKKKKKKNGLKLEIAVRSLSTYFGGRTVGGILKSVQVLAGPFDLIGGYLLY